jgi:hypothetical protein
MSDSVSHSSSGTKGLAIKVTASLTVLLALLVTAFAYAVKFLVSDLNAVGVTVEPSAILSYTKPLTYMGLSILALVLCAAVPALTMKGRALRPWVYSLTLSAGFVLGSAFGFLSARHLVQSRLASSALSITARRYAILTFSNMLKAGLLFTVIGGFAGMYLNAKSENRNALGIALLLACLLVILAYVFFAGPGAAPLN